MKYEALDYDKDAFTSSREGVVSDDPVFRNFLDELESIIRGIIDEWDKLRVAIGNDGDIDNTRLSPKKRKARELFSATVNEIIPPEIIQPKGIVEGWVATLGEEAQFNIPSYTECFVAENLLRSYISYNRIALTSEANAQASQWETRETAAKNAANISYDIRQNSNNLQYLSMDDLANLVDKPTDPNKQAGIARDAKLYKPVRDAVAHTSLLTQTAKDQLTIVFKNIQARLQQLLGEKK
jgi:hypothetical protein